MDKAYERIVWHNEPSILTPLNETNLNKMDYSLDVIDDRVVTMDTTKANQSDLLQSLKTVSYNDSTGVFTFTFWNGSTVTADLNIEKIPVDFSMSPEGIITMRTADGTEYTCDISELIKIYTFADSTEIDFTTTTDSSGNKTITAQIKAGSITGDKLQPNYLADCLAAKSGAETAESNAQGYAINANASALEAEGFAVGKQNGTDVPSTSPYYHNNAKYYCDEARTFTPEGYEELVQDVDELQDEMSDIYPTEVTDNEPYTLRQGKGDMVDMELVGGSFAWNQLVQNSDSSVTVPNGHKYIRWNGSALSKATSNGTAISVTGGTDKIYDVTQMFCGSTVADSITTEIFAKYFSKYKTYAYDSGSIQSVCVSARKVVGKNLLYSVSSDYKVNCTANTNTTTNIVNSFPVKGGVTYTVSCYQDNDLTSITRNSLIVEIDGVSTYENANANYHLSKGIHSLTFTPESDTTVLIRYWCHTPNVNVSYSQFMLEIGTTATAYEPYEEHVYSFDTTTQLRGIPSIVNNKLVYDGDIYTPNGITRKYGIVDLGTLSWTDYGSVFYASLSSVKLSTQDVIPNVICSKYKTVGGVTGYNQMSNRDDKSISTLTTDNRFYIRDTDYTSNAAAFTAAVSGVYAVYELATPTTESAEPFQNPQRADASGTEEFVDYGVESSTRDVSIPCGHNSTYKSSEVIQPLEDYVDGATSVINSQLSKKADITAIGTDESNNDTASKAYSQGDYFYKNGIAKAKTSIAQGATFTLNTNYEIKTLAEILQAIESAL